MVCSTIPLNLILSSRTRFSLTSRLMVFRSASFCFSSSWIRSCNSFNLIFRWSTKLWSFFRSFHCSIAWLLATTCRKREEKANWKIRRYGNWSNKIPVSHLPAFRPCGTLSVDFLTPWCVSVGDKHRPELSVGLLSHRRVWWHDSAKRPSSSSVILSQSAAFPPSRSAPLVGFEDPFPDYVSRLFLVI